MLSCADCREGFANSNSKHRESQLGKKLPREGDFSSNQAGLRDSTVVIIIQGYASQFGLLYFPWRVI
jgi:hypothetical protein